jgi:hypothetical protein
MARLRAIKGKGGANDALTHEKERIRRADAAGTVATEQYCYFKLCGCWGSP